ncbi:protein IQ-DOMAIN 30 [Arachis hypogaea]|uniref:protein IQ-DOMAIN 30 n=1 Tax=Arachis hypogaea TaxID=3818 RepID=UPI000DED17D3|nr:protein IQ-DOMAIN 31 [Arachis hypogaea]
MMGRQSARKWIRNLILGKKSSSKSNSSKPQDVFKPSSNKDMVMVVVSSEASMSPHPAPPSSSAKAITKGMVPENEVVNGSSNEKLFVIASEDEQANAQAQDAVANIGSEDHAEKINLTEAAIIAQAALRGYQARRKFEILKGMIPLQALIRGKLARREAVSALYCVKGIVKVQALARGYKVRHSAIGLQVQKTLKDTKCSNSIGRVTSTKAEKISDSVFVHKLLASSPAAVLSRQLRYEWLERWTRSRFWAPLQELKKIYEKNVLGQTVEAGEGKAKRNARKGEAVRVDKKKESSMALHSSVKENEKRKQHMTRIEDTNNSSFQRRASLPANYYLKNDKNKNESSQNTTTTTTTPRVPSYMAPTESAKAKLNSPRFGSDLVLDRNGISRRLSLSFSLNGKLGMAKIDNRSLSSSRDWTVSDKLIQPQWRR